MSLSPLRPGKLSLARKLWQVNWGLVFVVAVVAAFGIAMLFSAANGSFDPWASRQATRFAAGFIIMIGITVVDIRIWFRYAYFFYFGALLLLVAVEIVGTTGMGAQRWIDLKVIQLQPSEIMKIAIVLALARYFNGLSHEEIAGPLYLITPLLLVLMPVGLVLKQPDLGTAGILVMVSGALFFAAGVRLWKFALVGAGGLAAIPIAWNFLHEYQRRRVLTFINPETDPQGAGYHILQSKIALGSGGVFGKGFLGGTQAHLNFLPEKQTDFIFTMMAEELGMVGGLVLIGLYLLILVYGFAIALRARNHFGRLLAIGVTVNFFLYLFINIAMVMGLIPVVGVPLPLISYGGTALLTVMASIGLLMSVYVHRDVRISKHGFSEEG